MNNSLSFGFPEAVSDQAIRDAVAASYDVSADLIVVATEDELFTEYAGLWLVGVARESLLESGIEDGVEWAGGLMTDVWIFSEVRRSLDRLGADSDHFTRTVDLARNLGTDVYGFIGQGYAAFVADCLGNTYRSGGRDHVDDTSGKWGWVPGPHEVGWIASTKQDDRLISTIRRQLGQTLEASSALTVTLTHGEDGTSHVYVECPTRRKWFPNDEDRNRFCRGVNRASSVIGVPLIGEYSELTGGTVSQLSNSPICL
jgi:hypothetical protein